MNTHTAKVRSITAPQPPTGYVMVSTPSVTAEAVTMTMPNPRQAVVVVRSRDRYTGRPPVTVAEHYYRLQSDDTWLWDSTAIIDGPGPIPAQNNDCADRMLASCTQRGVVR